MPNIQLIMTDDWGYDRPGTFSGAIPASALDRVATIGIVRPWAEATDAGKRRFIRQAKVDAAE